MLNLLVSISARYKHVLLSNILQIHFLPCDTTFSLIFNICRRKMEVHTRHLFR